MRTAASSEVKAPSISTCATITRVPNAAGPCGSMCTRVHYADAVGLWPALATHVAAAEVNALVFKKNLQTGVP